jgi:hypothetical protein
LELRLVTEPVDMRAALLARLDEEIEAALGSEAEHAPGWDWLALARQFAGVRAVVEMHEPHEPIGHGIYSCRECRTQVHPKRLCPTICVLYDAYCGGGE